MEMKMCILSMNHHLISLYPLIYCGCVDYSHRHVWTCLARSWTPPALSYRAQCPAMTPNYPNRTPFSVFLDRAVVCRCPLLVVAPLVSPPVRKIKKKQKKLFLKFGRFSICAFVHYLYRFGGLLFHFRRFTNRIRFAINYRLLSIERRLNDWWLRFRFSGIKWTGRSFLVGYFRNFRYFW